MLAATFVLAPAVRRVLFVGDSFTYFNNLPKIVQAIAPEFRCDRITHGAWNLDQHWRGGAALARIRKERPDVVVLQEEGQLPANDPARFQAAARRFVGAIRAVGARPLLLMTWAPRSKPEIQAALAAANRRVGRTLRVRVAPVGEAWGRWRSAPGAADLFVADGIHPNFEGSYLSALVLAGTLRGRPIITAPTRFAASLGVPHASIPPVDRMRLLQVARESLPKGGPS